MAKRKFYATTAVAKDVNFNLSGEFVESPFKVVNTSVKRDVGEEHMAKIAKPTAKDLEDPTVRVFVLIDIEGQDDLWIKDMAVLNKHGFMDVIDINADGTFTLKDGACVSSTGETIEFSVK